MTLTIVDLFFGSGATAAYASLIWQFWNSRTRIGIRTEYFEYPMTPGLRFVVSNRGSKATTLTAIVVALKEREGASITHNLHAYPPGIRLELPTKLLPGDEWKGTFSQNIPNEDRSEEAEDRRMILEWLKDQPSVESAVCEFKFSHRDRTYTRRVSPESF